MFILALPRRQIPVSIWVMETLVELFWDGGVAMVTRPPFAGSRRAGWSVFMALIEIAHPLA